MAHACSSFFAGARSCAPASAARRRGRIRRASPGRGNGPGRAAAGGGRTGRTRCRRPRPTRTAAAEMAARAARSPRPAHRARPGSAGTRAPVKSDFPSWPPVFRDGREQAACHAAPPGRWSLRRVLYVRLQITDGPPREVREQREQRRHHRGTDAIERAGDVAASGLPVPAAAEREAATAPTSMPGADRRPTDHLPASSSLRKTTTRFPSRSAGDGTGRPLPAGPARRRAVGRSSARSRAARRSSGFTVRSSISAAASGWRGSAGRTPS